ncbi:hypothetical protein [Tenacibaculum sp. nBUS_03]|uniref:hypothetical protein n=1 Tax=Tenacibaculum sp. nBUS_03 TaxID=3395320 RepID=UPI003EBC03E4
MGMDLDLYVYDESIESPHLSRSFQDEIIFDWYLNFESFLSDEEIKKVSPNTYGEITIGEKQPFEERDKSKILDKISDVTTGNGSLNNINNLLNDFLIISEKVEDRERDPKRLKKILKKIQNHLIDRSFELPLVHSIFKSKELNEEVGSILIDGIEGLIEGDLYHYDNYENVRNKIHIKSYNDDYGKIDFYLDIKPMIKFNDTKYFTKSITKAEQFKKEFEACFDFLDQAIKANKKVLWEFG